MRIPQEVSIREGKGRGNTGGSRCGPGFRKVPESGLLSGPAGIAVPGHKWRNRYYDNSWRGTPADKTSYARKLMVWTNCCDLPLKKMNLPST